MQSNPVRRTVLVLTVAMLPLLGIAPVADSTRAQNGGATATAGEPASASTPENNPQGSVTVDGSATIGPALQIAAEGFAALAPGVEVHIDLTSSGHGIERFCNGETDLATSGRSIKDAEALACAEHGVAFDEFAVAFDGVAVIVHPANDQVTCLTADQLRQLWEPQSAVVAWQDLDSAWGPEAIILHGRGADSGTYQYFTQAILGEEGLSRDDYVVHDSHEAVVDAVADEPNSLGFAPFPFFAVNRDQLNVVAVDGGNGCTEPSPESIRDGSYAPLSRPLFVYVSRESLERPEVAAFLQFFFTKADRFAEAAGVVATTEDVYRANLDELAGAIAGTDEPDSQRADAGTPAP